ncbi:o-succinylbenzoate synthase [Melioribacteraceae bacterium 4301-Me]|uniref:o-succinylbenzoate synthase n=1 Tax=Pyranulibacter aquaticus TaxID=3163344 RepID=UPI00359B9805
MKIKEVKYTQYSLPFAKSFLTAKQEITNREGIILQLKDDNNNISYGEAAPLPEFNKESISQVIDQISLITKKIKNITFDEYFSNTVNFIDELNLFPSLRFALEQALLGLYFNIEKDLMIHQLKIKNNSLIPVNAVFGIGNAESVFKQISKDVESGFETIKLKLSKNNFSEEEKLIKMIRNDFGGSIKIRLDANSSWTYDQAYANLECLAEFDIEYIEEPCINVEDSLKLIKNSPIPIALDENVKSFDLLDLFVKEGKVKFLVLKPMTLGSVYNLLQFIHKASQNNVVVIISSLFETVVGRSALVFLSSTITHEHAHGIGIAEYFEKDIYHDPYEIKNGLIKFDAESYPPTFNLENLFE